MAFQRFKPSVSQLQPAIYVEPIPKTWASPKSSNFTGWQGRKMAAYFFKKNILPFF